MITTKRSGLSMKIGIITIHYGFNFGSALQAYALNRFINSTFSNVDVKLLNYIPVRYCFKRRYLTTSKFINPLKKILYLLLVLPQRIKNEWEFGSFLKNHIPMSPKFTKTMDAKRICNDYDLLITGSDQVWNSDYNEGVDPMYYLDFASEKTKKISYAASCGKDDYTLDEWNSISRLLSDFSGISLREVSSKNLFNKKGFPEAVQSLDPIFLLSAEQWSTLATPPKNPPKDYVLVYFLDSDHSDIIRIANEVAKARGLKTVVISYSHVWNRYNADVVYRNQNPKVFLWLMLNARYVVTNSFHGVAFSINFERQFITVKRRKYNNRLDSILQVMNLTNRYIAYNESFDNRDDINYSFVNELKCQQIEISKEYLKNYIKKD